jgi:hypothetical protein
MFQADTGCSVRSRKSSTRNARRTLRSNALVPEHVGSRTTFGSVNVSVPPRVRNWQPPAATTFLTQSGVGPVGQRYADPSGGRENVDRGLVGVSGPAASMHNDPKPRRPRRNATRHSVQSYAIQSGDSLRNGHRASLSSVPDVLDPARSILVRQCRAGYSIRASVARPRSPRQRCSPSQTHGGQVSTTRRS